MKPAFTRCCACSSVAPNEYLEPIGLRSGISLASGVSRFPNSASDSRNSAVFAKTWKSFSGIGSYPAARYRPKITSPTKVSSNESFFFGGGGGSGSASGSGSGSPAAACSAGADGGTADSTGAGSAGGGSEFLAQLANRRIRGKAREHWSNSQGNSPPSRAASTATQLAAAGVVSASQASMPACRVLCRSLTGGDVAPSAFVYAAIAASYIETHAAFGDGSGSGSRSWTFSRISSAARS